LAKVISDAGMKQLHIAETEKYAHVTFFLNGMKEDPFNGEDRVIVPSPQVSSYDQKPEMSAPQITERILKEIGAEKYDLIAANFANADMVGHTGNLEATVKAAEFVDTSIGKIVAATLEKGGIVLITADHGNAEEVVNLQTGSIDKEHSTYPVPFLIIGQQFEGMAGEAQEMVGGDLSLSPPVGMLSDVTPTILRIMGIPQPSDMTGRPLI
jgi:2,3-bisphosphoglycerate-independent phosphoglycerate mutase